MKVFCIFSDERAYQLKSPSMFSTVLKQQGILGTYVPFVVRPENLGKALQSLHILNIAGANITVPYKEAVLPFMDQLSEGANIIGAVNTIVRDKDRLKGYNTNAIGIMDALGEAKFDVDGKKALVFGAGGAARAVVFILNWLRTDTIYVVGRHIEKSKALVASFSGEAVTLSDLPDRAMSADIIINATPVSSPDESPEMADLVSRLNLSDCQLVLDLNYGRRDNFWREAAQNWGARFMDGLPALAYQARRTFALWTKLQVPADVFLKALNHE
jgi:shikimate dehydrogenase